MGSTADQTPRCRLLISSGAARPDFSARITSTSLPLQTASSEAASLCRTRRTRLIALYCVCVRTSLQRVCQLSRLSTQTDGELKGHEPYCSSSHFTLTGSIHPNYKNKQSLVSLTSSCIRHADSFIVSNDCGDEWGFFCVAEGINNFDEKIKLTRDHSLACFQPYHLFFSVFL